MSDFSTDWLRLREPADARARAPQLTSQLVTNLGPVWTRAEHSVVDLGAGTGANLRYLAPRLGTGQHWRCLDHDPSLLDRLPAITEEWAQQHGYRFRRNQDRFQIGGAGWDAAVYTEEHDLEANVTSATTPAGSLITASALLDLVSESWLRDLIARARHAGCQLLFALSYDGGMRLLPEDSTDRRVNALVNRHQRRDKGFGPALGPDAPAVAAGLAVRAGYRVASAASDWRLGAEQAALQQALVDGWVEAALEIGAEASTKIEDWHRRRTNDIALGKLIIEVGHRDMLAATT
jgi:hypothetical protein